MSGNTTKLCTSGCGDLSWTLVKYGRLVHKHACPERQTCQTHPEGCPADLGAETVEWCEAHKSVALPDGLMCEWINTPWMADESPRCSITPHLLVPLGVADKEPRA